MEGHPGGLKSGQLRTNKQIDPESLPVILSFFLQCRGV